MSRPVLILAAVSAGATALTGVLATIPGISTWVVPVVAAIGVVATAIGGVLTTEQVAPWSTIGAQKGPDGLFRAGPASPITTGQQVDVTEVSPTKWA